MITPADTTIIITALTFEILKELGVPSPGVTQGALIYAGWQLAIANYLTGVAIVAVILLGGLAGAIAAYFLARHLGIRFIERFPKFMKITPEKLEQVKIKLGSKTLLAMLFFRLVIPLKVTLSAAAGLIRIRFGTFAVGVAIGLMVWEAFYVIIGAAGKGVFESIKLPWDIGLIPAILITLALGLVMRFVVMWGFGRWEKRKSEILYPKS